MNVPFENSCPMTRTQVLDAYFMEHRARLLDIAAFLDRLDRAAGEPEDDIRETSFRRALEILTDGRTGRAGRILTMLSDQTTELPVSAAGMKGAIGAPVSLTGDPS